MSTEHGDIEGREPDWLTGIRVRSESSPYAGDGKDALRDVVRLLAHIDAPAPPLYEAGGERRTINEIRERAAIIGDGTAPGAWAHIDDGGDGLSGVRDLKAYERQGARDRVMLLAAYDAVVQRATEQAEADAETVGDIARAQARISAERDAALARAEKAEGGVEWLRSAGEGLQRQTADANRRVAELTEALEWYADRGNYGEDADGVERVPGRWLDGSCSVDGEPFWEDDLGQCARAALASVSTSIEAPESVKLVRWREAIAAPAGEGHNWQVWQHWQPLPGANDPTWEVGEFVRQPSPSSEEGKA